MDSSSVRVGTGFGDAPCEFSHLADTKTEAQRGYTVYPKGTHFFKSITKSLISLNAIRNRVYFEEKIRLLNHHLL